jgi:putative protease
MIGKTSAFSPAAPAAASAAGTLPELLAPAGDWACARAAVENGADAIYFGLEQFNARMRADNFKETDLPALMEHLHRRGLKGYVALNTLVFENELPEAERYLRSMISAGVDAVIVQDVGICRLIRRLSPDFPIHASTQMTITSAAGVDFARDLGCDLVVLARECSIEEIEKISRTSKAEGPEPALPPARGSRPSPLPLEVFVHGALCVAYSGQCLTSEALGGRSANRGECAQACRLPYELIADGAPVPLGDRRYLLSPRDLAGLELLPELMRAGVASLKIEGRLKTPEYVASITRIYREALDALVEGRGTKDEDRGSKVGEQVAGGSEPPLFDPCLYEMEMAFSRGLHTGWLEGINNQQLVHGRFGKKRGVYLGEVEQVWRDRVRIRLVGPLKPGDGVVFDAGKPEEKEEGGRVYEVRKRKSEVGAGSFADLAFGRGDIDFSRVHIGDRVWKTSDPELDRRVRQSFAGERPGFRRPIMMEAGGRVGEPLTLLARDESGHEVRVRSEMPLVLAENQPLTTERLREQLGRLGGTAFRLDHLENRLDGAVMLPVAQLNRLRREAVAGLEQLRSRPRRWILNETAASPRQIPDSDDVSTVGGEAELIILVRNLAQVQAALEAGATTLYCDFEDPKRYKDAVATARIGPSSTTTRGPAQVFVAPPRVFKTGEEWTLRQVASCGADGYLVRNYDHLDFFAKARRIGDYSLNVANRLAADYFKNRFGLERLTPSYDLNTDQLEALLRGAPPAWFEVTLHQHMPLFHMEHCVFCAFLSSGTDYTNCGRPCDRHEVRLRDRVGSEHPVKADAGCRNTVFQAQAQTGAESVSRLLALGVRHFRVEFLNETPAQVAQTIMKYRQLLRGEVGGAQLWRELKLLNQLGVTRGPMAGGRS